MRARSVPEPIEAQHPERQLFAAAEELARELSRETLLRRLTKYRRVASIGLSALAPPAEWAALLAGLPSVPEGTAVLLSYTHDDDVLDDDTLGKAVAGVRAAAAETLRLVEALEQSRNLAAHRRVVRTANWFVVGFTLMAMIAAAGSKVIEPVDLAKGKPWRASSTLFECHPERIECGGVRTSIFFHTDSQNEPWVEIDLGTPTEFSAVTVRNRSDAAPDRAVPLVLEVSDDRTAWRRVTIQSDVFKVWKATFAKTKAQYVRLRSTKQTYLHLDSVKVHP